MLKGMVIAGILLLFTFQAFSQNVGDYRSRNTRNWNSITAWQVYDGSTWLNTTIAPTSANKATIQNAHTITVNLHARCP